MDILQVFQKPFYMMGKCSIFKVCDGKKDYPTLPVHVELQVLVDCTQHDEPEAIDMQQTKLAVILFLFSFSILGFFQAFIVILYY